MQLSRDYNKKSNTQDPILPPVLFVWAYLLNKQGNSGVVVITVYEYTQIYNKIKNGISNDFKCIQLIKPKDPMDYFQINKFEANQIRIFNNWAFYN